MIRTIRRIKKIMMDLVAMVGSLIKSFMAALVVVMVVKVLMARASNSTTSTLMRLNTKSTAVKGDGNDTSGDGIAMSSSQGNHESTVRSVRHRAWCRVLILVLIWWTGGGRTVPNAEHRDSQGRRDMAAVVGMVAVKAVVSCKADTNPLARDLLATQITRTAIITKEPGPGPESFIGWAYAVVPASQMLLVPATMCMHHPDRTTYVAHATSMQGGVGLAFLVEVPVRHVGVDEGVGMAMVCEEHLVVVVVVVVVVETKVTTDAMLPSG